MKKLFALLVAGTMILSIAGCKKKTETEKAGDKAKDAVEEAGKTADAAKDAAKDALKK